MKINTTYKIGDLILFKAFNRLSQDYYRIDKIVDINIVVDKWFLGLYTKSVYYKISSKCFNGTRQTVSEDQIISKIERRHVSFGNENNILALTKGK